MKKSKNIQLTIIGTIAASLMLSCAKHDVKHCVDANDMVVDEANCNSSDLNDGGIVSGGTIIPFRWYYGNRIFYPGTRVSGGSYLPGINRSYSSSPSYRSSGYSSSNSSSISRGGFGSIGKGSSFGGGE